MPFDDGINRTILRVGNPNLVFNYDSETDEVVVDILYDNTTQYPNVTNLRYASSMSDLEIAEAIVSEILGDHSADTKLAQKRGISISRIVMIALEGEQ